MANLKGYEAKRFAADEGDGEIITSEGVHGERHILVKVAGRIVLIFDPATVARIKKALR